MKKILSALIIVLLTVSVFSITVSANDFTGDNEFVIASFNGVHTFIKNEKLHSELEDACWWLVKEKDAYNIKYVSFIGQIGNPGTLKNTAKLEKADYIKLCLQEEAYYTQYQKLASLISPLKDEGIPSGVSMARLDYAASGSSRSSVLPEYLSCDRLMPSDVKYEYYDEANYYVPIENNGTTYMVFQLEL